MKGNDLSPHCDAQQSELDQGECLGYISGVADSMSNIICIPPDVETGQLLKVATNYMRDNLLNCIMTPLRLSSVHWRSLSPVNNL